MKDPSPSFREILKSAGSVIKKEGFSLLIKHFDNLSCKQLQLGIY
ncbi:hypothetical protein Anacy_5025 [Anabaena cylindrica PCC 7122]|uniref:Uncharacterized protein n=1 Tax=Anabaena cylindrica (strain ATCC 27899 / PCC 7122) TaxID=272123 RepID=K9ZPT7_ANACC|nr:hypothetical protein Anacy_5025 [Anabaena cylindrica PCC 7122]BAY02564.1 hypothetical protein NIES19_18090 [Anabaena cylindrica PCC 7122]